MSYLQCKEPALFVYLAWGTRNRQPVLSSDEVRQAAYLAVMTRTRSQLCRILAIGGTTEEIHLVVQFPPSLSVSTVARIAQEASSDAIAYQSQMFQGRPLSRETLWRTDYTTRTLPQIDAAEAQAYLRRQIAAADPAQPADQK